MQRGGVKKDNGIERDQRLDFMTEQEIRMVDDYLTKIEQNRGNMGEYYERWEEEQIAYAGDQVLVDNRPNSRVNITNANIEGQIAGLIDQNLEIRCTGQGPSDQSFSRWAEIGLDWTLRKNNIKMKLKRHATRFLLFGPALFKLHWDEDAVNGFGLCTITCPPLNMVFIDQLINDPFRLQEAEYIAEVILKSKTWAEDEYGDVASNIFYGGADRSPIFTKEKTTDDEDAFWLIQLWTKTDGNLRLIEFSEDGVLLYDSFKEWDGKKFRELDDPEPFYRYNKYPYFLSNLYYEEGKLYGFGDGKLLRPLQDMINDLYDQIRRAARPNRIFFDPESDVELSDIDEDDGPVPCLNPNQTIRVVEAGTVNEALWRLLANIHIEVQRVIRFSELMIGQRASTATATEANIQHQQGASGIDHKKLIIQDTLNDLCYYMLDMMMEKYEGGRWFRIAEDKDDYEWVDFRQLNMLPVQIPASEGFINEFKQINRDAETPQFEQLTDKDGKPMTKQVDLDIKMSLGAGLPKNKAFLYQMLERLSRMAIEGRSVLTWSEMREFVEDFLGFPLKDEDEIMAEMQMQQQQQMAIGGNTPMQSPNTEGMTQGGQPARQNVVPMMGGGGMGAPPG